jgi:hypothetical protein
MKRISQTILTTAVVVVGLALGARAQATRTWVSGVGDDVNPCSRTAPCKTWAGAISKTAAGGEIDALDPGGFGGVTITKAITIDGGFNLASVLVSGTNGITINAGGSDVVTLRRLTINGIGTGLSGVAINSAGAVVIDNVRIFGFTVSAVQAASAQTDVEINDLKAHNSNTGLSVAGSSVTARNSDFSLNNTGVAATGSSARVTLDSGTVSYCATALSAQTGASIRISNMSIMDNTTGLFSAVATTPKLRGVIPPLPSSAGGIISFGNNRIFGNTNNSLPNITVPQE